MHRYLVVCSAMLIVGACGSSSDSGRATRTVNESCGSPEDVTNSDAPFDCTSIEGGTIDSDAWLIPESEVRDGGPGKDGIPALETLEFITAAQSDLSDDDLIVGVKQGDDIKAYPHNILNWHEIVNDNLNGEDYVVNFCPLTGSSMLWESAPLSSNKTFGVSGLLYNSNLILYDRETDSNWSQMRVESVNGSQIGNKPVTAAVVETTWGTWQQMYPETLVLSENTGFTRDYDVSPYGKYTTNETIIFLVNNREDDRLHVKERVLGIKNGSINKVYEVNGFAADIDLVNEELQGLPLVVVGSSGSNFAVAFERTTDDGGVLNFTEVQGQLPIIMQDDEGNQWDIFGVAVSGPRTGQTLKPAESYIAYWFAWTAFFPNAEIFNNN